jgi:hypothetical protein
VDRFALSRYFSFVRQCDEIHSMRDIGEVKDLAITLLRLNKAMRETVEAMIKSEIPTTDEMPLRQNPRQL